jgi:hypothetical protein
MENIAPDDAKLYAELDRVAIDAPNGCLVAILGLGSELYVEPRERGRLRLNMLKVQEDYCLRFRPHKMRYEMEIIPNGHAIDLKDGENPFAWVRGAMGGWPAHRSYYNLLLSQFSHPDYSGKCHHKVTPWASNVFVAAEKHDDKLSYHSAYMPLVGKNNRLHFDLLRKCVLNWAKILRPAHGLAGATVITEIGAGMSAEPYTYATLRRYPGLDIQTPVSFINETKGKFNRIKCVNWLTVLGDAILAELGGVEAARKALEPECTLYPYPGGLLIQAGPLPRWGDTARGLLPEAYCAVAHFTQAVRFTGYRGSLFHVFAPMIGCEEAEKWVRRFDEPVGS